MRSAKRLRRSRFRRVAEVSSEFETHHEIKGILATNSGERRHCVWPTTWCAGEETNDCRIWSLNPSRFPSVVSEVCQSGRIHHRFDARNASSTNRPRGKRLRGWSSIDTSGKVKQVPALGSALEGVTSPLHLGARATLDGINGNWSRTSIAPPNVEGGTNTTKPLSSKSRVFSSK